VTGILELAHLLEEHGVAQVKVWGGRIESYFDAERTVGLQKGLEFPSVNKMYQSL